MRINRYLALQTGISRRKADEYIKNGQVVANGKRANLGDEVVPGDAISIDGKQVGPDVQTTTLLLNKPVGFVCSRDGQGSQTIYELLPETLHHLKPAGRLDKDSSGLLIMTNDGQLANKLTHPSYDKEKVYQVTLGAELTSLDEKLLLKGVELDDGLSKFKSLKSIDKSAYEVILTEGRNRQIRRTFQAINNQILGLHRIAVGRYSLKQIPSGKYLVL